MQVNQKLHPYAEDGHDTGVVAYSFDEDSITVLFREGWYYLYDRDKPGGSHVNKMKELAAQGYGLSTYISQYVRENYRKKWQES